MRVCKISKAQTSVNSCIISWLFLSKRKSNLIMNRRTAFDRSVIDAIMLFVKRTCPWKRLQREHIKIVTNTCIIWTSMLLENFRRSWKRKFWSDMLRLTWWCKSDTCGAWSTRTPRLSWSRWRKGLSWWTSQVLMTGKNWTVGSGWRVMVGVWRPRSI